MDLTQEHREELALVAAALLDEGDVTADELSEEFQEDAEDAEPRATGITSHILRCRQGLGNAYVYDDSSFKPPSTGEMWTRVAFYNAGGVRLLLTAWRYKGSANPYMTYFNRWTWRNTEVKRSLVIWYMSTGWKWSNWASC